ncbi:MAG: hypothetical protein IKZ88_07675 [Neisseriaceae bacterium]|nr:hypothetical protein [Neisseriaceae bacterium]
MFCLVRQNGLYLDNASIFLSGSLKKYRNAVGWACQPTNNAAGVDFNLFRQPEIILHSVGNKLHTLRHFAMTARVSGYLKNKIEALSLKIRFAARQNITPIAHC